MARKKETYEGRRVEQVGGKGKWIPIVICAGVAAVLAAGYIGLCAWASGHILPQSEAAGVALGGLSHGQAAQLLEQAGQDFQGQTVDLVFEQTRVSCELDQAQPVFDTDGVLAQLGTGNSGFLTRGAAWIGAMTGSQVRQAEAPLAFENREYVEGMLEQITARLSQPVQQHAYQVEDEQIRFTRGQAGMTVDLQQLEYRLLERLAQGDLSDLELEPQITQPAEPDFEQLRQQVYVEPQSASLDPETFEITPSVTGVSFDVATAQALFERAEPGETFWIPLDLTDPAITTEQMEASLFADMLGEAKSNVSGSSGRRSNVNLAASFCDGTILLPGEVFSYWDMIAPCTREQGFLPAPTYLNGLTVDGIGGGVCQVSSSIYTAALYANLEIVERRQHTYSVGYLPNGSDAMVSGGNSDFKFKNSTEWPIKITAHYENSKLTVQLWGTKTDDTYVEMEYINVSIDPRGTVYEIDDSVPAGTTKVKATGYTGYKNETYRCVYSGDGTLISRTLESKNSYARRDTIVLVNSADAAQYGLGEPPASGTTEAPQGSLAPEVSPTPEVSSPPEVTPPAQDPASPQTTPPAETQISEGEATPAPEESPTPEVTPTPEATPTSEEGYVPPPPM